MLKEKIKPQKKRRRKEPKKRESKTLNLLIIHEEFIRKHTKKEILITITKVLSPIPSQCLIEQRYKALNKVHYQECRQENTSYSSNLCSKATSNKI